MAVLLICGFIFSMSAKSSDTSTEISGSFITTLLEMLDNNFKNLSPDEQLAVIDSYQFFVRKTAHFSIYAALGFFSCGFITTFQKLNTAFIPLMSVGFVALYAASDEIHQLFSLGRSGQVSDVLLDTLGGILGVLVMFLIAKKFFKKERAENET